MKRTKWLSLLVAVIPVWFSPVLANENDGESLQSVELEEMVVLAPKDALADVIPKERLQMPSLSGSVSLMPSPKRPAFKSEEALWPDRTAVPCG